MKKFLLFFFLLTQTLFANKNITSSKKQTEIYLKKLIDSNKFSFQQIYHENGNIYSQKYFMNDFPIGLSYIFYRDGKIYSQTLNSTFSSQNLMQVFDKKSIAIAKGYIDEDNYLFNIWTFFDEKGKLNYEIDIKNRLIIIHYADNKKKVIDKRILDRELRKVEEEMSDELREAKKRD